MMLPQHDIVCHAYSDIRLNLIGCDAYAGLNANPPALCFIADSVFVIVCVIVVTDWNTFMLSSDGL